MFRKLSVAALLVLASGAQAQKKVTKVDFCATPTLETFDCRIDSTGVGGGGAFQCPGALNAGDIVAASLVGEPTGTHLSRLFPGACPATGAARIGAWQAECAADIYQPIVRRLADAGTPGTVAFANAAALQAACNAAIPTPAQANTADAFCNAQLSVTENVGAKAALSSKLGSSTWYNYLPVPTYTAVGGYINQVFNTNGVAQVFCVYWPSYNAVAGNTGGGTNKWAKPIIDTVTTTSAATNTPAGTAGFLDANAANTDAKAAAATNLLLRPEFRETITVNYHKNGPPAGSL